MALLRSGTYGSKMTGAYMPNMYNKPHHAHEIQDYAVLAPYHTELFQQLLEQPLQVVLVVEAPSRQFCKRETCSMPRIIIFMVLAESSNYI